MRHSCLTRYYRKLRNSLSQSNGRNTSNGKSNCHVIEGMDTFSISVNDKEYECTVVGTDPTSDLAVLHADLKGDSLTPIEIGNSDNLAPGSWVMSVGSPFALLRCLTSSLHQLV